MSSLSTSAGGSAAPGSPVETASKKKRRRWKIGKRGRSTRLREKSAPPTTLHEEEEEEELPRRWYKNGRLPQETAPPVALVEEGDEPPRPSAVPVEEERESCPSPVEEQRQLPQQHQHRHTSQRVVIHSTDVVTTDTERRRAARRPYTHHQYNLQQIKRNHKAILSDELFMKLAEEEDFDDFIKLNRISFAGDYLLGRMLRERTRIQCKRDMLHSELETYVKMHCCNSSTSGSKSTKTANSTGCSERSDDRSVLFSI